MDVVYVLYEHNSEGSRVYGFFKTIEAALNHGENFVKKNCGGSIRWEESVDDSNASWYLGPAAVNLMFAYVECAVSHMYVAEVSVR